MGPRRREPKLVAGYPPMATGVTAGMGSRPPGWAAPLAITGLVAAVVGLGMILLPRSTLGHGVPTRDDPAPPETPSAAATSDVQAGGDAQPCTPVPGTTSVFMCRAGLICRDGLCVRSR
jgi:hypothetical protein